MRYSLRGDGPYTARSASDTNDAWPFWYVAGPDKRTNVLEFLDHPGAVLTTRDVAEQIANDTNGKDNDHDQDTEGRRHVHARL